MTDDAARGSKLIEGKVAGILTERELAINVGSNHGVTPGMKFRVMANTPTEVTDPQTGEVLGTVTREKVRVRATQVEPKFALCKTYRLFREPGGPLYYAMRGFSSLQGLQDPPRETPETLKAADTDYLPDLPEEESFVKKGDVVVQILGED